MIVISVVVLSNFATTLWILFTGIGVTMLILAAIAFCFFVNWTAWRFLRYDNEKWLVRHRLEISHSVAATDASVAGAIAATSVSNA